MENVLIYPEGWEEVKKTLNFLPDDTSKNVFLTAFMMIAIQW